MASHLISIDCWEIMKGILGTAFGFVWFFIKEFWWGLLILILTGVVPFLLFKKWKMPVRIGRAGENIVIRQLNKLDSTKYKILNDIMLPSDGNSSATQIDHIVVSNFGIFCIETKAYQGWIFGSANDQYWTQVIYRHKERFYNPLWQNYAHIKAVEKLLGPELKAKIQPFVVFPDVGKLKITGTDSVGYHRDIVHKIQVYQNQIYTDVERDDIANLLRTENIVDKEKRKAHNKEVRNLKII